MIELLAHLHWASLFTCLGISAVTDFRWRKIYNSVSYTGMVLAVTLSGVAWWIHGVNPDVPTLDESLLGWFACGMVMVVCYVFFPGEIGGGDVKLVAMLGAFFGVYQGLEALLWSLVLGSCVAVIRLVWLVGVTALLARLLGGVKSIAASGGFVVLSETERQTYATKVYLAPCALMAAMIVRFGPMLGW